MKDATDKPRNIDERTLAYGVRAVRLYRALAEMNDGAAWVVGKQYLRSATSIGANIAEAKGAESTQDLAHKYGIAQKEAHESAYWLALLEEAQILPKDRLAGLRQETDELIAIITTIILNVKRRQKAIPGSPDP